MYAIFLAYARVIHTLLILGNVFVNCVTYHWNQRILLNKVDYLLARCQWIEVENCTLGFFSGFGSQFCIILSEIGTKYMLNKKGFTHKSVLKKRKCCAQHLTSLTNWKSQRNLREISATKKHIQCTFIEKGLHGLLWFEIILYKQRPTELFVSYVMTIHHRKFDQ
ncbi:hypothetical protein PROFUN_12541 [Planoprotostelium fungivorum]|uniref:Uncharacterized protein n=1 Tax=Planoprotostelium fungivorum TaxID=1890364 RepID=A0A2P6N777_9EUKA|nr:hypothetical protein PROFUN_12541 [Planoprotostelium fungivorum]